jgi:dipeptidyl aminopeptidase/acylaminoacyl peptidase
VLLAHGVIDDNVPIDQFQTMEKAARKSGAPLTTLVIPGEGHSFFFNSSQQRWLEALDGFLAAHNPADQPTTAGE